jgi:hypothetical protein
MTLAGSQAAPAETLTVELEPDKVLPLRLYIRADPRDLPSPHMTFRVIARSADGAVSAATEAKFESPEN